MQQEQKRRPVFDGDGEGEQASEVGVPVIPDTAAIEKALSKAVEKLKVEQVPKVATPKVRKRRSCCCC